MSRLILLLTLLVPLASADEFTELVDQLGDRSYRKREAATRQLYNAKTKYFQRLRGQIFHTCPETRYRVRGILRALARDLPTSYFISDDKLWEMKKAAIIRKFEELEYNDARKAIWDDLMGARVRPRKCADLILRLDLRLNAHSISKHDWQPVETLGRAARLQWLEDPKAPNPYLEAILEDIHQHRFNEWRVLAAVIGIHTVEVYDALIQECSFDGSLFVYNNKTDRWDHASGTLNPMVTRILQEFPVRFHYRAISSIAMTGIWLSGLAESLSLRPSRSGGTEIT